LVGLLTMNLSPAAMENWGWRVPFFAGSLIGLVALGIRARVPETPLFERLQSEGETVRTPLRESLRRQPRAILLTFALAGFNALSYYLVVAFVPTYLVSFVKIEHPTAMHIATVASAFNVAFIGIPGDLFFFSDPRALHEELGDGAVSLTAHRFPKSLQERERYGIYNVGWLGFRNDERGRAVAQWWRDRCNEWCRDELDGDRFADQKYLEQFAKLFPGIVVLSHEGANVAPWNVERYSIVKRDGALFVKDGVPLVFFHFHGLRLFGRCAYLPLHRAYGAPFRGVIRRELYRPYVAQLAAIAREVVRLGGGASAALARPSMAGARQSGSLRAGLQRMRQVLPAFLCREVVLVVARRVI
jgi:hypothetical protein